MRSILLDLSFIVLEKYLLDEKLTLTLVQMHGQDQNLGLY